MNFIIKIQNSIKDYNWSVYKMKGIRFHKRKIFA